MRLVLERQTDDCPVLVLVNRSSLDDVWEPIGVVVWKDSWRSSTMVIFASNSFVRDRSRRHDCTN